MKTIHPKIAHFGMNCFHQQLFKWPDNNSEKTREKLLTICCSEGGHGMLRGEFYVLYLVFYVTRYVFSTTDVIGLIISPQ